LKNRKREGGDRKIEIEREREKERLKKR